MYYDPDDPTFLVFWGKSCFGNPADINVISSGCKHSDPCNVPYSSVPLPDFSIKAIVGLHPEVEMRDSTTSDLETPYSQ